VLVRQSAFAVVGCLICFGLVGCGNNPLGRKAVAGTVSMDGEPLDYGAINFHPLESNAQAVGSGAVITDGEFSIPAAEGLTPGRYRVSIVAPSGGPPERIQGEDAMKTGSKPPVERLPSKYNTETELTAEVTSDAPAEFDFSVESIKQ
jgi:hypothetical protein